MKNKKYFILGLTAMLLAVCSVFFAPLQFGYAQEQQETKKIVSEVFVKNNKVISTQVVLSKIKTKAGVIFSQELINEDLKRLYATDYFSDVSVDIEEVEGSYVVSFIVKEKPVLSKIIFEGNEVLKEDRLKAVLTIKTGETLDMRTLKIDLDNIAKLYEKRGFHKATVNHEIKVSEETNEATLFIIIEEGIRYRLAGIVVKGNKAVSTKEILKSMKTKRDNLLTSGFFKEEDFERDVHRIKSIYLARGYSDVKIEPELRYVSEEKKMHITLLIEEGKQYKIGGIAVTGNQKFALADIQKVLDIKENDIFSQMALERNSANISSFYFEKGYIFAQVTPQAVFNEEAQKIDVSFRIEEGELAYIDKIIIRGNDKTKDVVIRRELRFAPGEAFDGKKLQRSKERLYNLGFFEEITYDIERGSAPNKKNLVVNVRETKTGEFSFGAGYSSVDKFLGFVQVTQRNFDLTNPPTFTGDGQKLTLKANLGSERKDYLLGFTEPWIFDYPVSFGFDVYRTFRGSWEDFDVERTGGDVSLGKEFSDYTKGSAMYKLERIDISNLSIDVSDDLLEEEGENTLSRCVLGVRNDTRDSIYSPTRGHILGSSLEYAGTFLGGDKDYIKIEGEGRQYFTHFKKFILELRVAAGLAEELDDTKMVPIYERFYLGGPDDIRGYKLRHVSPKDTAGHPVGGKSMALASAEYTFPLISNLRGAVFYDIGNVWREMDDFGNAFKSSLGLGVRLKTPLGPVKVDYGYGLNYDEGEKKGNFHFNMSREF